MLDNLEGLAETLKSLDKVLHEKTRLAIATIIFHRGKVDFKTLKRLLDLTDGNLATHLKVLEQSGYIKVEKRFVGRKPQTVYEFTEKGSRAYRNYLKSLARLFHGRSESM
ncbi:MAG TPA: transcriptional regulator [Thermoplasmatales archaeon]|nr:transcriptional regulator [Thermoplasmatales archaeon]HEX17333.1 transcriptional regulator [Thermoplasmatales archaeon]